jgi:hypothetical protein
MVDTETGEVAFSDHAAAPAAEPLWLPSGVIRKLLIAGVAGTVAWLAVKGRLLAEPRHLRFCIILAGLIVGHFFGRFVRLSGAARGAIGHVKGVVGLLVAAALAVLFGLGKDASLPPLTVTLLCAVVSFYFGSRT